MNHWIFWSLLSALFAGLTAVLAKIGVSGIDSTLATAVRTTVVLVFTWLLVILMGKPPEFGSISPKTWLFLALSGLATGLSWLCYFRALQLGEASRVAPVDKLSVLFVMGFAALVLKEQLSWQSWLGGALILAGAILLALAPQR